jgi:hypothetical protein
LCCSLRFPIFFFSAAAAEMVPLQGSHCCPSYPLEAGASRAIAGRHLGLPTARGGAQCELGLTRRCLARPTDRTLKESTCLMAFSVGGGGGRSCCCCCCCHCASRLLSLASGAGEPLMLGRNVGSGQVEVKSSAANRRQSGQRGTPAMRSGLCWINSPPARAAPVCLPDSLHLSGASSARTCSSICHGGHFKSGASRRGRASNRFAVLNERKREQRRQAATTTTATTTAHITIKSLCNQ